MIGTNKKASIGGERACTLTAVAIADIVGGELRGDPATTVSGVCPLDRATAADVSFASQARYAPMFRETKAGVVLVTSDLADTPSNAPSRIVVANPHDALLSLLPKFYPERTREPGIRPSARIGRGARIGKEVTLDEYAVIGANATIGDGVWIGSNAVIGDGVTIGDNTQIYPNVTVYAGTTVGMRVRAHS